MAEYAHPEVLVSTDWVADHCAIPTSASSSRTKTCCSTSRGTCPARSRSTGTPTCKMRWCATTSTRTLRRAVRSKGIANDTTVVFYGDKNNWWACYAFWVFKLYGHEKCLIMNGGRKRWELDGRDGRAIRSRTIRATEYHAPRIRICRFALSSDEVLKHTRAGKPLVDVRSPGEYTGELLHMPDYPQEGRCAAATFPARSASPGRRRRRKTARSNRRRNWRSFTARKTASTRRGRTIAYCRIGERSSHTWFVLKYLLGFSNVKNYDGSWTEWGNMVGVPIARGAEPGAATSRTKSVATATS